MEITVYSDNFQDAQEVARRLSDAMYDAGYNFVSALARRRTEEGDRTIRLRFKKREDAQ